MKPPNESQLGEVEMKRQLSKYIQYFDFCHRKKGNPTTVAKMEWWNCKAFSAVTICSALTIMSYMTFVDVSNDPLATEHGV